MRNEEFMNQKAKDMTISELGEAIKIKCRTTANYKPKTFVEEIRFYPERFERLTGNGWTFIGGNIIRSGNNLTLLNDIWNNDALDNNLFYVSFSSGEFKEIIRRKENE